MQLVFDRKRACCNFGIFAASVVHHLSARVVRHLSATVVHHLSTRVEFEIGSPWLPAFTLGYQITRQEEPDRLLINHVNCQCSPSQCLGRNHFLGAPGCNKSIVYD